MADNWIKDATSNSHGQFAAKAHKAGTSTAAFAQKEKHAGGKTGQQARLAATLMRLPRHADGDVSAPQANWYDRLRSILMGKSALEKAAGTAPPTPPPEPTSIDYVRQAAEAAGKRNDEEKKREAQR